MLTFRDSTQSFWAWAHLPLLPDVATYLPAAYPCSRCRWRVYKVASGDADSRCGRLVFLLDVISIASLLLCFTVSSLPDYRERAPGQFGGTPVPARVFQAVSLACAALYAALYALRLGSVTAVPGREELAALAAQVQQEGAEGGAREFLLAAPFGKRPHPLSSSGPSPHGEGGAWEEDSEEEEEELAEERAVYARSGSANDAGEECLYARGGCGRSTRRLAQFLLLPSAMLDLASFLPVFLDLALGSPQQLLILRVTRFLRVLRLLRATSETLSFRLVRRSLKNASGALLFSLLPTLCVVLVMFSAGIFLCEGGEWDASAAPPGFYRPDVTGTRRELTPFRSVVHSTWFVLVTLSTLGYGDMTPTSAVGKLVTALTIATGIM